MTLGVTILFLLMIVTWVCIREFSSCFRKIHVHDSMPFPAFLVWLLVVTALVSYLAMTMWGSRACFSPHQLLTLLSIIVIVLAICTSTGIKTSAVSALWGAVGAIAENDEMPDGFPVWSAVASLLIAPAAGALLFAIFRGLIDKFIFQNEGHLLIKNLYFKRLLFIGIVLSSVAMWWNYSLLIAPLVASVQWGATLPLGAANIIVSIALAAVVIAATAYALNPRRLRAKQSRHLLPHLYSVTAVTVLSLAAAPLFPFTALPPVILSVKQMEVCNKLVLEPERLLQHGMKLLGITVVTPLMAFIVGIVLFTFDHMPLFIIVTSIFVVVVCMLAHLYFNQYKKHRVTKKALTDELIRKSEVGDERNRQDVDAIASQFNVMSKEIDLKYKELINLSLYIKQQRQYLEELSLRLKKMAKEPDADTLRAQVTDASRELKESLKLSDDMDHFYNQVDENHKNFVSRLLMRCPTLTEREKRLAILIRLGYSSKDIASLMNVEPKTIEISRYRFRRKLKLDRGTNIVQYLQLI